MFNEGSYKKLGGQQYFLTHGVEYQTLVSQKGTPTLSTVTLERINGF